MGVKKSAKQDKPAEPESASQLIDERIKELSDWRGEVLSRVRRLIKQADPEVVEEWKWRGVPVWSHEGIICTGESYKNVVKLTFAKGASLKDPAKLFNSSLEGNVRRAIDLREGEEIDESAFKSLVREAAALNASRRIPGKGKPKATAGKGERSTAAKTNDPTQPKLLSGGNPQIAMGYGDAPVQAYIAVMPGWKSDVGRRLDALVVQNVPNVRRAVKWNTPFYGVEGQGWFLAFHVFTRYIRVTFFRGTSLRPIPPGESKTPDTRYLDIHEGDHLDEELVASWIRQASELPGWMTSDIRRT